MATVVKTSLKKGICVLLILIAIISPRFSTNVLSCMKLKSRSDDITVAKKCNKMFDAGKVSKICLCCTSPFHITDLVMCSAYSFPALYFVYLAVFFNWVLCLIPNLKFSSFSAFHGNELGSILLRHRIKNIRI